MFAAAQLPTLDVLLEKLRLLARTFRHYDVVLASIPVLLIVGLVVWIRRRAHTPSASSANQTNVNSTPNAATKTSQRTKSQSPERASNASSNNKSSKKNKKGPKVSTIGVSENFVDIKNQDITALKKFDKQPAKNSSSTSAKNQRAAKLLAQQPTAVSQPESVAVAASASEPAKKVENGKKIHPAQPVSVDDLQGYVLGEYNLEDFLLDDENVKAFDIDDTSPEIKKIESSCEENSPLVNAESTPSSDLAKDEQKTTQNGIDDLSARENNSNSLRQPTSDSNYKQLAEIAMLSLARAERNNMDKARETQTLVNKLQEELQRSEHLLHVHKRDEEAKMNALKSKFYNESAEMHRQLEEKVEQMRILQSNLEQSTGKINEYKSVINALEIRLTSVTNITNLQNSTLASPSSPVHASACSQISSPTLIAYENHSNNAQHEPQLTAVAASQNSEADLLNIE